MSDTLKLDGHELELSRLDKTFFPEADITKGDVIEYYRRIAPVMLPYMKDRPLAMHRWPDGIEGKDFFHKDVPDYFPDWISRCKVKTSGDPLTHVLCNNAATLVYLANQACLTPHIWLSRKDRLDHPDRVIFDLDPPEGGDFGLVRSAALHIRERFEDLGLVGFAMTTGSKGLHVMAPIRRELSFDEARGVMRQLASELAEEYPDRLTVEQRKNKRGKRVYLDTMRNAYGQTAVAPYSIRALPGAPVAAPVEWDEVADSALGPQSYTIGNIFRRLGQKKDPWKSLMDCHRSLQPAARETGSTG